MVGDLDKYIQKTVFGGKQYKTIARFGAKPRSAMAERQTRKRDYGVRPGQGGCELRFAPFPQVRLSYLA